MHDMGQAGALYPELGTAWRTRLHAHIQSYELLLLLLAVGVVVVVVVVVVGVKQRTVEMVRWSFSEL